MPPVIQPLHTIAQHDCVLPTSGLRVRIFYPCLATSTARFARWMPVSATRWSNENVRALFEYLRVPAAVFLSYFLNWAIDTRLSWRADVPVNKQQRWSVALFSHGLGSSLAGYVSVCADIARTGRIVVAVEHGDGSAHAAYIGKERRRVPYIHPPSDHDAHDRMAEQQNLQRIREFDAVIEDLRAINSGTTKQWPLPPHSEIVDLKESIDVQAPIVVAGHSFGSATSLGYTLASWRGETKSRVSHTICLDPWISPVGADVLLNCTAPANARILHVDQEQTGKTLSVALREDMQVPYKRVCVLGGVHNNATDFATKLARIITTAGGLAAKGIDAERLMNAQNGAVVQFVGSAANWDQFEQQVGTGNVDSLSL